MGECTCRRTGRHARLHELPCGDHMIVVRAADGHGWTAIHDDNAHPNARFAVWPAAMGEAVELEDRPTGQRRPYPSLTDALVAVCGLCGQGVDAPCRPGPVDFTPPAA